jgi:hypothetical protein
MNHLVVALLVAAGVLAGVPGAGAETADCRAQLKRQEEQCQLLAEKLEKACPGGQNIKDHAECRGISTQIANSCTRNPCAPPKKKKAKTKAKSKAKAKDKPKGKAKPKAGAAKSAAAATPPVAPMIANGPPPAPTSRDKSTRSGATPCVTSRA